ncbi:MAG: hypothetical protein L0Y61_07990 [Epsilonproteobacteria bacterium]|nr:hypothetical protein [Campylobacterota bacterium]
MLNSNNVVEVRCDFGRIPTLAMFIEAAAQSSAAFDLDNQAKIGFLTMAKEIKLLDELKARKYIIKLKKEAEINQFKQFSFEAREELSTVKCVSGYFTLVIQNNKTI